MHLYLLLPFWCFPLLTAAIEFRDILSIFDFSFEQADKSENLDFMIHTLTKKLESLEYRQVDDLPIEDDLEIKHLAVASTGSFRVAHTQCRIERGRIFAPRDFKEASYLIENNVSEIWINVEKGPDKSYSSGGWPLVYDIRLGDEIRQLSFPRTWKSTNCHLLKLNEAKVAIRDCSKTHRFLCLVRSPQRKNDIMYNTILESQKQRTEMMRKIMHDGSTCLDTALIDPTQVDDRILFQVLTQLYTIRELFEYFCNKFKALTPLSQTESTETTSTLSPAISTISDSATSSHDLSTSSLAPRIRRESLIDTASQVCTRVSKFLHDCGEVEGLPDYSKQLKQNLFKMSIADLINITLTLGFLGLSLWIGLKLKLQKLTSSSSPPRFVSAESLGKASKPGGSRA